MIDPSFLRDNPEAVRAALATRGGDFSAELEDLATLETQRRRLLPEFEGLKRQQNAAGDEVARAKRQGLDVTKIQEASRARNQLIKQFDQMRKLMRGIQQGKMPDLGQLMRQR